jgi:hypothetical protein
VVKTYFIKSVDDLQKNMDEMKLLADFHNARVCINLNKRSFERTCFHALKKITDQIMNKDYPNARKAYNSVCGMYSAEEDRKWIVDIDVRGRYANEVLKCVDNCDPKGNKLITILDTKNGVHLITKPFNLQQFKVAHPDVEVHKNNPTVVYIP